MPSEPARPPLNIAVTWHLRTNWRAVPLLRRAAESAAAAEGFRTGELAVAVVGARAMARLHAEYSGVAGPTDVLTFDLGTERRRRWLEGQIVVCADVAAREARVRSAGHPAGLRAAARVASERCTASERRAARGELALYVVHGVLHLAGYDDHAPRDFRRMHAREDELLAVLGLGCVFAGDRPRRPARRADSRRGRTEPSSGDSVGPTDRGKRRSGD